MQMSLRAAAEIIQEEIGGDLRGSVEVVNEFNSRDDKHPQSLTGSPHRLCSMPQRFGAHVRYPALG